MDRQVDEAHQRDHDEDSGGPQPVVTRKGASGRPQGPHILASTESQKECDQWSAHEKQRRAELGYSLHVRATHEIQEREGDR